MEYTSQQHYVLTSGSDLNRAAEATIQAPAVELDSGSSENRAIVYSPWPPLLPAGEQLDNGWKVNNLQEVRVVKLPANYGGLGSVPFYQFRAHEYPGVGGMPGPIPSSRRPTYNNLEPVSYRLEVLNPKTMAQPGELITTSVVQTGDLQFEPGGVATLQAD